MEHVLHLIDAALGGELGAAEREALDAHLAACPTCAAAWRGRRAAWDRLDVLAAPVAAAAAESRVWPAV
ncbi:zf-HC2 domain-containing protein, partial [bacterium]|nr:zf-HC2 domain-containing protein [bacterium]